MKIKRTSKICIHLFLINTIIVGCVNTNNAIVAKPDSIEHYEIFFCEKYNKKLGPINRTNTFIRKDNKKAYVIVKLLDLIPNAKYKFKFEWYRPDGKLEGTKTVVQRVSSSNWYTGNWLNLDHKYDLPSGLWSVKILADDRYLGLGKFLLAGNQKELTMLQEKYGDKLAASKTEEKIKTVGIGLKHSLEPRNIDSCWAVIVGLSKYKYSGKSGLKNLIFADDDAKSFNIFLKNAGWSESHIKLLIDEEATKRNIEIVIGSWLTKAGPNDLIVLFWAGHGFSDPEDPERVYFACYDTDISIPVTGYRMDHVRATLEERRARNVILISDTCHAGKLITRGDRGVSIVPNIEKMRRENTLPKGWIFMVGADTDRKAIEHTSWGNGAFTHSLLNGLSGEADGFNSSGVKNGIVTMGELKDYMNNEMPNVTQKVTGVAKRPIITTSTGNPDIWNLTLQLK